MFGPPGIPNGNDPAIGGPIPPNNALMLAEKIVILYEKEVLRKTMGENARKRVIQSFDWQENVDQMKEIYKNYQ